MPSRLFRRRSLGALALACGMSAAHQSSPLLPQMLRAPRALILRGPRLPMGSCALMSGTSNPEDAPESSAAPTGASLSLNPDLDYSLKYRVLAFYVIAPIEGADAALEAHRKFLADRQMVGRVYLCEDGMNAQVSGLAYQCAEYRDWIGTQFPSTSLLFKEDPVEEPVRHNIR